METIWQFNTAHFRVAFETLPEDDLDLSWDESGEVAESIESGELTAFVARVAVYLKDGELALGVSYLGNCVYESAEQFYVSHRDSDPANRNCTAMRAARGENVVICHYFPSLVREAVAAARKNLRQPQVYVRPGA